MTRYERRTIPVSDDGFEVDGTIVHVLDAPSAGKRTVTALVEVDAESATTAASDTGDTVETPTCSGTKADDSPCGRDVDEEGGRCWQHPRDD